MKCAASAGGTIQSFYYGLVRCQLVAACRRNFCASDIAGEKAGRREPDARPTLARESRHIVPLKLSGTTSRAADRFLSSIE